MWKYRFNSSGSDELMHFGIKGQKWGIRRFQYENGSYTEEGKERYGRIGSHSENNKVFKKSNNDTAKKILIGAGIVSLVAVGGYIAYKNRRNGGENYYPDSWPKNVLKTGEKKALKILEGQFKSDLESQLSSEEKSAIYAYTDIDYRAMNYVLETGGTGNSPYRTISDCESIQILFKNNPQKEKEIRDKINHVSSALDKCSTKQDMIVDRRTQFSNMRGMFGGISAKELAGMLEKPDQLIGRELKFDGFCSTTVVKSDSNKLFGSCNLHIFVPKGSKAACIAPISNSPKEGEVLLQHGSRFRLVDIKNFNSNKEFVYGSTVDLFLELIND